MHGRHVHARSRQQRTHMQVRTDVLLCGWCVHDDERRAVAQTSAEITTKTRIRRSHLDALHGVGKLVSDPVGERREAQVGSGHERIIRGGA